MASDKMKVRQVPASSLKAGDIFVGLGELVKVIFKVANPPPGMVRLSCIDGNGEPCFINFGKNDLATKVTDRRVVGPKEA